MNRIYQGRVSAVEVDRATKKNSPDWQPAPGNDENLWRHHALFQDGINYYLVGLLALAARDNPILGPLLSELDQPDSPRQIWNAFTRRGQNRPGLSTSVAPHLTPGNAHPTMAEAFAAILAGNEASPELRDLCVSELLAVCAGDAPIKNEGAWMLARFCVPSYNGSFPFDAVSDLRKNGEGLLSTRLHELTKTAEFEEFASQIQIGWVVNTVKGAEPATGEKSRDRLIKALTHFEQAFGGVAAKTKMGDRVAAFLKSHSNAQRELIALKTKLTNLETDRLPSIPANNRSIPDRLEACLLFKYFPGEFTASLLKVSFPLRPLTETPSNGQTDNMFTRFGGDAIELARGQRGYVFRCFTSLPVWAGASREVPEPTWREFDIAAFKYALTALNQIEEKTKQRNDDIAKLKADLVRMNGEKPKTKRDTDGSGDEPDPLPVLGGDPRIELLRAVVAGLKVDTALTDGDAVAYGLQRRTVRGFRDLRRLWRAHAPAGIPFSRELQDKLRVDLRQFQTDNPTVIGSEALFRALLDEPNWPIWQEPDVATAAVWADAGFADNPLDALVQETEFKEDIERLRDPVKLTPAHPIHSRRQYDFNAVSKFSAGPRAANRHEPGRCAFTTEIAACENGLWSRTRVRIVYSAPRLLRDGLRREEADESLAAARWLQPMMAALAPLPELPQNLTDMPVMLMPDMTVSGERRVLLNFPVTLEPEKLVASLGKHATWLGQFCGTFDEPFALRWPADGPGKVPKGRALIPWYETRDRFTVLGVDLGTRDAGALAHLTVVANTPIKPISRVVGEAGEKIWHASLTAMHLIKLPGEDTTVFVHGKRQPEPYGDKGRMPSTSEYVETREIIAALGQDPADYLRENAGRLSFPELNSELLRALRCAQGRLARLQSWSWKLRDTTEAAAAREDLLGSGDALAPALPAENEAAAARVAEELLTHRERISGALVQIANRVVPLRGRRWVWQPRADLPSCHVLRQTDPGSDPGKRLLAGQRGISHRRIEQIEELRHRCQSLNRALQHVPGEKPRMGRRTKGDELPDPCPDLLEKMERLREQRVDQTAHTILAAALGVRLRAPAKDRAERAKRDFHGEYERFRDPVDFIAIENLSRYLSSQDRARSENTRLMQWCHRQLVQKLRQLCESYGIPVLAAPAAYSSRFSSRDGSAGFRAVEVSASDRHQWPWKQDLERLRAAEAGEKKLESHVRQAVEATRRLFDLLDAAEATRAAAPDGSKGPPRTLLAPMGGGPIFIPLGDAPPMQADLNAATNIALRAIAAPDRHDIHQRIRTERKGRGGKLQLRRDTQREKARWPGSAPALALPTADISDDRQPNLFIDVAGVSFVDKRARIGGLNPAVATGKTLWTSVRSRAWDRVASLNAARLAKWREGPAETDVQY